MNASKRYSLIADYFESTIIGTDNLPARAR